MHGCEQVPGLYLFENNALLSEEVKSQVLLGVSHIRVGLLALFPILSERKERKRWRKERVATFIHPNVTYLYGQYLNQPLMVL